MIQLLPQAKRKINYFSEHNGKTVFILHADYGSIKRHLSYSFMQHLNTKPSSQKKTAPEITLDGCFCGFQFLSLFKLTPPALLTQWRQMHPAHSQPNLLTLCGPPQRLPTIDH